MMTSHDREFMNRIVSKSQRSMGARSRPTRKLRFYERERAIREAIARRPMHRQQAMLAKEQRFIERFSAHAAKAAQCKPA